MEPSGEEFAPSSPNTSYSVPAVPRGCSLQSYSLLSQAWWCSTTAPHKLHIEEVSKDMEPDQRIQIWMASWPPSLYRMLGRA